MIIISLLRSRLSCTFKLRWTKYFLGIELARSSTVIFLKQRKYALDILANTGMSVIKPSTVPIEKKSQID